MRLDDALVMTTIEKRNRLKEILKFNIENACVNNSYLIIACYPSERILELIMIFFEIWKDWKNSLKEQQKIIFFHNYSKYLDDITHSLIEYMNTNLRDQAHNAGENEENPLNFKFLNIRSKE